MVITVEFVFERCIKSLFMYIYFLINFKARWQGHMVHVKKMKTRLNIPTWKRLVALPSLETFWVRWVALS